MAKELTQRGSHLLLQHELDELIIYHMQMSINAATTTEAKGLCLTVNAAVAVLVRLADHLVHFIVCELLANRGHHVAQLGGRDVAVVVAVEHLKRQLAKADRPTASAGLTLNASRISSSESVSFILRAIMVRNSVVC